MSPILVSFHSVGNFPLNHDCIPFPQPIEETSARGQPYDWFNEPIGFNDSLSIIVV